MGRSLPPTAGPPSREAEAHELEVSPAALLLQGILQVCKQLEEGRQKGSWVAVGRKSRKGPCWRRVTSGQKRESQGTKGRKGLSGCVGFGELGGHSV